MKGLNFQRGLTRLWGLGSTIWIFHCLHRDWPDLWNHASIATSFPILLNAVGYPAFVGALGSAVFWIADGLNNK